MAWLRMMALRLRGMFARPRSDSELQDELRAHLEMLVEENIQRGMTPEAAQRSAKIELGGSEQIKEAVRDQRGLPFLESLVADVRFGLRMLRKNPGFTAVAILTLALGIGANTAIFSIVNSVLLRSLPVKDPQQMVLFTWDTNKRLPPKFAQTGADSRYSFSYPEFAELSRNQVLSSAFAFVPLGFSNENLTVSRKGDTTSANAMMVTGQFFSGLGVAPFAGRAIADADEQPEAPRVAVISYAYWDSHFGRDPQVVGGQITFNGLPFTVVGVTPPSFYGVIPGARPDIYVPFDDAANLRPWSAKPVGSDSVYNARGWLCLNVMGRLKPGVSREEAQAALGILYKQFLTEDWKPANESDVPGFSLTPAGQGMPYLRRLTSQPLLFLLGAVAVVLLIACANVATLLLARAPVRAREISVRLAMGASRGRLVRQLLTESVILSLAGGLLGFLIAEGGTRALLALPARGQYAVFMNFAPDWRVFFATIAVAAATGVLFGLAPALRVSRIDLAATMKDSAVDLFGRRDRHRLGHSLVIAQVGGSLMLMVLAGLFLRTLVNLARNNYGFNQSSLLTFGLDPTRDGYQGDRLSSFYSQLLARVQTLPGVSAATVIEFPPFSGISSNSGVSIVGSPRDVSSRMLRWQTIGPDFFNTMRIPVLLGRGVEATDTLTAPRVVVVDEKMAGDYFGADDPVGRRISMGGTVFEIAGVVKAAELTDVHSDKVPKAYFSYQQMPRSLGSMYFEVRARGPAESVISEIRAAVRQTDPNLPLLSLETQSDIRDEALTGERIIARLSTMFGVVALVLAVIGLYGTIAFSVARKTHEIGIRMALGARPADVLGAVLRQGMRLAGAGVLVGVVATLGVTRLVRTLMFGVSPSDPATFAGVAALLLAVALAACWIPARRATRVDPMVALRHE